MVQLHLIFVFLHFTFAYLPSDLFFHTHAHSHTSRHTPACPASPLPVSSKCLHCLLSVLVVSSTFYKKQNTRSGVDFFHLRLRFQHSR